MTKLIARCTLEPNKFVWVKRGLHQDGSVRYGKVKGGQEYPFQGTRAELDVCKNLEYVEGEEDPAPEPKALKAPEKTKALTG